jgi:threonine/homoserine/homoserine lactone efflux protein
VAEPDAVRPVTAFRVGLTTNLLNPKVGVFYLSVLPQFMPDGMAPLLASTALAGVHVLEGLLWSAAIIVAVRSAAGWIARPVVRRRLDQVTGVLFVGLGVRLAAEGVSR